MYLSKRTLAGLILAIAMIPMAQAANIHWDIIETVDFGPDTLTSTGPFAAATIIQNGANDWFINLAGLGFTAHSRTISWMDLTPGLFNRVVSTAGSNLIRVRSDLGSCAGNGCPNGYSLGVSFFVGTMRGGRDSIFASFHEVRRPRPVPEPSTLALFGLGLAGLGIRRRQKQ